MDGFMIRRRQHRPERLRVKGVKVTMTPAPDDAELAAQALLETLCGHLGKKPTPLPARGGQGVAYYKALAQRVHKNRLIEVHSTQRYITYAEQQLQQNQSPERLIQIEKGLYQFQNYVEREQGELKKRWQYCLAEVLVQRNKTA